MEACLLEQAGACGRWGGGIAANRIYLEATHRLHIQSRIAGKDSAQPGTRTRQSRHLLIATRAAITRYTNRGQPRFRPAAAASPHIAVLKIGLEPPTSSVHWTKKPFREQAIYNAGLDPDLGAATSLAQPGHFIHFTRSPRSDQYTLQIITKASHGTR